jgi:hypothetical protein
MGFWHLSVNEFVVSKTLILCAVLTCAISGKPAPREKTALAVKMARFTSETTAFGVVLPSKPPTSTSGPKAKRLRIE